MKETTQIRTPEAHNGQAAEHEAEAREKDRLLLGMNGAEGEVLEALVEKAAKRRQAEARLWEKQLDRARKVVKHLQRASKNNSIPAKVIQLQQSTDERQGFPQEQNEQSGRGGPVENAPEIQAWFCELEEQTIEFAQRQDQAYADKAPSVAVDQPETDRAAAETQVAEQARQDDASCERSSGQPTHTKAMPNDALPREHSGSQIRVTDSGITSKGSEKSSFPSLPLPFEAKELDAKDLSREPYEFPVDITEEWPAFKSMSTAELVNALHDLATEIVGKGQLRPYHQIRAEACAINIELNRRGKLAPQFRDMRRPPHKIKTIDGRDLSLDRQVIDLHWLHSIGWDREIECDRLHLRKLLLRTPFSLEHAEMFAEVPAPFNEKAGWLALPDHIAFQLAAIKTDAVRERFRVADAGDIREGKIVQRGRRQIVQALEASVANQPNLQGQVRRWAMIWMCSRLVGDDAEVLRGFHAVAEGLEKPLDRRDIVRRLAGVKRRLGKVRAHEKIAA